MPFLLAEILNFQGSTHRIGVGSFSYLVYQEQTQEQPTALPTVDTIDSTSKGITMRMINYDSAANGLSNDIKGPYTVGWRNRWY